jgi:hypothetical protein
VATTSTESTSESSSGDEPTSEDYQSLVRDYYGFLPGDADSAWALLTDSAREKSNGKAAYKRFWKTVRSVDVLSLSAEDNEVEATLKFVTQKNRQSTESYLLTVVEEDGELMIGDYEKLGRPGSDEEDDG